MNALRFVCQRNIHQIRQFHKCIVQQTEVEVAAATATAANASPVSESVSTKNEPTVDSKIDIIANQIIALNLIEVAQLSDLLKQRLNLPDAPMMPMGGMIAATKAEEEEEEAPIQQNKFTIKLMAFDEKQKVNLIKHFKTILTDCNLVQAKKFVESAPVIVRADISKEEAEKLKESITQAGGTVDVI